MSMVRGTVFFFFLLAAVFAAAAQKDCFAFCGTSPEAALLCAMDSNALQQSDMTHSSSMEKTGVARSIFTELYNIFGNHSAEGRKAGGAARKSDFESSWAGVGFGYLNLAGFASGYDDDYKLSGGWRFSWNIADVEFPFSERCGLVTGIGYQSDVFLASDAEKFAKRVFIDKSTGEMDTLMFKGVEKSKLLTRYITLPLLFEFQTSSKAFSISTGVLVGWNIYSRLKNKRIGKFGETIVKYKNSDLFTMNTLKAEAVLRLAYRHCQLYFAMALTPLFDTCIHDKILPYSVGINISF